MPLYKLMYLCGVVLSAFISVSLFITIKVNLKVPKETLVFNFQIFLVLLIYLTEIKLCTKLFCVPLQHVDGFISIFLRYM